MRLYELAAEYRALNNVIEDAEGEIGPLIEEALNNLDVAISAKVDGTLCLAREAEASADALGDEIARLTARKKAYENQASKLRGYVLTCLIGADVKKLKTKHFTVSVRDGSESIQVSPEGLAKLPPEFVRIADPQPDKVALKKAIELGQKFEGVESVVGPPSLQVR
jgi:hypothetical protein